MIRDFDTAIVLETAKVDVEDAFRDETRLAFQFNSSEEEYGALNKLQNMLLSNKGESIDSPIKCFDELLELFKNCTFESEQSIGFYVPDQGYGGFRCGKLPDGQFSKEEIPDMAKETISRITGIEFSANEIEVSWGVCVDMNYEDYAGPREYFMDNGLLGLEYVPKAHRPGERWRNMPCHPSIEVNAVILDIKEFTKYLVVDARLIRWGIVMYTASKMQEFQKKHTDFPEEWNRILLVLDVYEEDVKITTEFASKMHLLDPIHDLIPIRVLEVITVFRVLFRLSLQEFELAYRAAKTD